MGQQQNLPFLATPQGVMFWPWGGCFAYGSTNFPNLPITFPNFFHNVSNIDWTITSFN
jgi:hypothetical protein